MSAHSFLLTHSFLITTSKEILHLPAGHKHCAMPPLGVPSGLAGMSTRCVAEREVPDAAGGASWLGR